MKKVKVKIPFPYSANGLDVEHLTVDQELEMNDSTIESLSQATDAKGEKVEYIEVIGKGSKDPEITRNVPKEKKAEAETFKERKAIKAAKK